MLKKLIRNKLHELILIAAGHDPRPYKRDIEDVLYEHPELTERQADWKLNGRTYIIRWVVRGLLLVGVVAILYWFFSR